MANYNVTTADAAWLADVYQTNLGRAPDAAGADFWLNQLAMTEGTGREHIINAIRSTPEGQLGNNAIRSNPVAWLDSVYQSTLGRGFDIEGASYWLNQLAETNDPASIVNAIRLSPEARAGGSPFGNPDAWLDSVYMTIFGYTPEPEARAYWLNQLYETGDAANVVHGIWQFGKKPSTVPNRPLTANAEIPETAGEKTRKRYTNLGGRKATILTGPQGLWDSPPSASPVLLGG